MIEAISREGDWRGALFDQPQTLLQPLNANGAALLFEGQVLSAGEVPGHRRAARPRRLAGPQPRGPGRHPHHRPHRAGTEEPRFAAADPGRRRAARHAGLGQPGEWLVWFRPEQVQTVIWGGDPFKPVIIGNDPTQLSPRRSFAQWHQVVEGTAERWTPTDLAAARLIGDTVTDVVLQFRSVRMLIALATSSSRCAARSAPPTSRWWSPMPRAGCCCSMPPSAGCCRREPWSAPAGRAWPTCCRTFVDRAEVGDAAARRCCRTAAAGAARCCCASPDGEKPLLLRADPVFSSPERVLGFVFLFTDLADRKAVETARRRFQEGILEGQRLRAGPLESKSDLVFRTLLQAVVENAQLAALEITEGVELSRIPEMLDQVRASAARAAEVLEGLIRHAAQDSGGPAAGGRERGPGERSGAQGEAGRRVAARRPGPRCARRPTPSIPGCTTCPASGPWRRAGSTGPAMPRCCTACSASTARWRRRWMRPLALALGHRYRRAAPGLADRGRPAGARCRRRAGRPAPRPRCRRSAAPPGRSAAST